MNIPLTEEDLVIAEELSERTYQKYKNYNGHYRNLRSSHSIGRFGELAAHKYFKQLGMNTNPHFLNVEEDSLCDITADAVRWMSRRGTPVTGMSGAELYLVSNYHSSRRKQMPFYGPL